ncbi:MAG: EI24 domain-containing protein [Gulosibacter sp.]|uniref:EI24 domain-containing protein n=1 Tax=Gulosibacter sp. TaxID=2817531 RepID=UPI003F8EE4B7
MRGFWQGVRSLFAGFGWWRVNPGVMAAGLIPALIVAILLGAALVALAIALPDLVAWLTPWAAGWTEWVTNLVRIAVGAGVFVGALVLAGFTFTAITLVVGEPFYDRIWKSVERQNAGGVPDSNYSFWGAIGDSLVLILRGIGIAILTALLGLIPFVGGFVGAAAGLLLSGWVLADELTSRALTARGIEPRDRATIRRLNRGKVLGFGTTTSALFLIPLGAIVTMPAAVAGSTLLVHELLSSEQTEARSTR